MAQQDVDLEALSEDEVVDLTVDDDDWDEIEVDSLYSGQASVSDCSQEAAAGAGFQRS